MPWKAERGHGCSGEKPWAVIKTTDGSKVACHETKTQAQAQVRALYANESMAAAPRIQGMVALYPALAEAEKLAQPAGRSAEDLHLTLCFLPYSADPNQIGQILAGLAGKHQVLTGHVSGEGHLQKGADGIPTIVLPSVVGLNELRADIADALTQAGIVFATNYGWVPHITLSYNIDPLPAKVIGTKLSFSAISFVDEDRRYDYKLQAKEEKMSGSGSTFSDMSESVWYTWTGDQQTATASMSTPVTITITPVTGDEAPVEETAEMGSGSWEGVLAVIGSPSIDKRYLMPGEISNRELPLPLRVQPSDVGGHDGAVQVGRIESISYIPFEEFEHREDFNLENVSNTAIIVWGEGEFDGPADDVALAKTMIRNGAGTSIDLPHDRLALIDPETFQEVLEDEVDLADVLSGKYLTGIGGKIAATTLVDITAFEEATIRLRDEQAVVASSYGLRLKEGLVASVGLAPLAPPKAWFEVPEPDGPCPLTVTDDGQVYGHLATWSQCHASFPGSCELAPRSKSGYQFFHLGTVVTAEGDTVPVGRVTVGKGNSLDGGHYWDLYGGAKGAIDHYDKTGTVGAFVRAKDGKYGIWLCGATRSDASPEAIRDMRANPPSGDWRYERGGMELVAALSVPVPGYPVPYVMASAGDHPISLVATGYVEEQPAVGPREASRRISRLMSEMREELAQICPACGSMNVAGHACEGLEGLAQCADEPWMSADHVETLSRIVELENGVGELIAAAETVEFAYNAEQRRKMAKSGTALPDGSFPIGNCSDAEKAIHAQGRAQDQGKAVAHIKKRVRALGCSGDIFENYK